MKRGLKRIIGFCEVVVPSYAIDEFRSPFRSSPQDLAATGQISPQENRTFSSSHFDASHVTQIKIGVWPGTGFEWHPFRYSLWSFGRAFPPGRLLNLIFAHRGEVHVFNGARH